MKLTIERSTLLSSLAHVQSVVERRNTIPILANVRIDAQGSDRLRLTATDMDLAVVDEADAAVEQEGAVTTTALTLYDIVRKLPDGAQVAMNLDGSDGGQLDVVSGRSRFRLSCLPIAEFPVMADDDLPHSFELPRDHLRRLIDKTRFAISTEETRYYLNGIHLHKAEDQEGIARLRAVATDGHRLSCADVAAARGCGGRAGRDRPAQDRGRSAQADRRRRRAGLRRTVRDQDPLRSRRRPAHLQADRRLVPGLRAGNSARQPERDDGGERQLQAEAVDRVSSISTDRSHAIKLSIRSGAVTLTANSPDTGTATEELDAEYGAEPLDIGLNARYVLDVSEQIDSDSIRFFFGDAGSPSLVRDTGDSGALHVIMPLRV